MWSVWSRVSDFSSSARMVSGWQSIPRFSPLAKMPILLARKTLSRLPLSARPQRLVVALPIEAGGIEMVIAQLDRAVEQGDAVLLDGRSP
jgi:hypothetical protein